MLRVVTHRQILVGKDVEVLGDVLLVAGMMRWLCHVEALEALNVAPPERIRELPGGHLRRAEVVDLAPVASSSSVCNVSSMAVCSSRRWM
jgi:hypothetical protein